MLQPPRTSGLTAALIVILPIAAIAAVAVVVLALLSPPGPETGGAPAAGQAETGLAAEDEDQPAAPRTEQAVRDAAATYFDRYAAGDYAGSWDLWSAEAQSVVSREVYARTFELCRPIAENVRFEVGSVVMNGDRATVTVTRLIAAFSYEFRYEEGRWRIHPPAEILNEYRGKTAEQVADARHQKRLCQGDPAPVFSPPPAPSPYSPPPLPGAEITPLPLPGN